MNKFWTRVFLIAAAALFLLFFSNDFGLINIQQTTIVTAIGIDRSQEEGKIDVSAQIAVPNESKASSVLVQGAETVGEAIAEFNGKTGWYPTLVHCRLVLLGAEAVSEDVFASLDYFLRSEFVEDSCLVAVCETTAAETLQANSPVGDLPSSAITKVLSSQAQKTGQVSVCNLRDFAKGYFSDSASGYLPVISVKKEASKEGGNQSSGNSQGADSASGGSQSADGSGASAQSSNDSDVFDASKTALFFQGKRVAELTAEETLAFNLADTKTDFAYGDIEVFENGSKVTYNLKMKIGKKSMKLKFEDGVPVFTFRIRAKAQISDADKASGIVEVAKTALVPAHVLRAAEEMFRAQLQSAFEKTRESGCDLFRLRQKLYRFCYPQYASHRETLLQDARIFYDIRFDTLR